MASITSAPEPRPATAWSISRPAFQVNKRLQLFAQINNLLDHHYYTAAQLGPTGFTNAGAFIAQPLSAIEGNFPIVHATFYAPGAPIGAFGGMRFSF